ncbi:hypothetical protein D6T63_13950 [Arthrobacter cheniae]|uniref:Uncharacterized protein n=1 Tax=Arthrobacter cheniae TaxID=1258888 RepID=A0A3A5MBS3_9MICC|nr:hypothetical protein [Arthrobacter cheniae]RJT78043.1 hypothetical protein D6T63_13950 [Arthrobacter cheniae]
MEFFSTWYYPVHVVFDIDIQREPAVPAPVGSPASPAADALDAVVDRARRLGADLLRFADRI